MDAAPGTAISNDAAMRLLLPEICRAEKNSNINTISKYNINLFLFFSLFYYEYTLKTVVGTSHLRLFRPLRGT